MDGCHWERRSGRKDDGVRQGRLLQRLPEQVLNGLDGKLTDVGIHIPSRMLIFLDHVFNIGLLNLG